LAGSNYRVVRLADVVRIIVMCPQIGGGAWTILMIMKIIWVPNTCEENRNWTFRKVQLSDRVDICIFMLFILFSM